MKLNRDAMDQQSGVGAIEVEEFVQAVGQLVRRLRVEVSNHDLSMAESLVLARLEREGQMTTAELARAERVRPQSMGATVAALEEMRLVERRPHPTDGRQMNLVLTARGVEVRQSTKAAKRTWLAQAVSRLEEREQETLVVAGRIIKRLAEQ